MSRRRVCGMTSADQGNQAAEDRALCVLEARHSIGIRGDRSFLGRIWPPYTVLHHAEVEYEIFFTAEILRTHRWLTPLDELQCFCRGISYGDRTAELYLYPVRQAEYSKEAAAQFRVEVLPMIKNWLDAEMSKSDTHYLRGQVLVIEWTGETHKMHLLRRR
jgi:hypothetical protein